MRPIEDRVPGRWLLNSRDEPGLIVATVEGSSFTVLWMWGSPDIVTHRWDDRRMLRGTEP